MKLFFLFLFAVAFAAGPNYTPYGEVYTRALACKLQMGKEVTFCKGRNRDCMCTNPNALATVVGCMFDGKKPQWSSRLAKVCRRTVLTEEAYFGAYENFTKYAKKPSEIEGFNRSQIYNGSPIILNKKRTPLYREAYERFLGNYDHSIYYGAGLIGFWGVVFLFSGISHWNKFLFPGLIRKFVGPISNPIRKYITMPALFHKKRCQDGKLFVLFDYLLPSRMESIVVFLYAALIIFCCSHNIIYVEHDPIYRTKAAALTRYVADRTGILATFTTPLLILFAGRNNFLQYITGINFSTFIVYHKWVSRFCFILAVIHAGTFTKLLMPLPRYRAHIGDRYLVLACVATVAGGIIWMTAILWVRRNYYETFLLIHIAMAALWVAGSYVHVVDLGYVQWYYASIAIWGFDRVVRVLRILWFGFPEATVTLLANDTLKVTIPTPKRWKPIPGGHAFIHFLKPSCFWQSHPFTFTTMAGEGQGVVTMYLKVKGGVTHSFYRELSVAPGKTRKIRVALEGPYGESTAASRYDNAVFIAGGNGIPGIYSEVTDLANKDIKQTLKLYWVIREYKSLMWMYEELKALEKLTKIKTVIYVTQPDSTQGLEEMFHETDIDSEKKKAFETETTSIDSFYIQQIYQELSHIEFREGRPDIEQLLKHEIDESQASTCFVACGHPLMCDDIRYFVANNLDYSKKRVDYYEQLQVWS